MVKVLRIKVHYRNSFKAGHQCLNQKSPHAATHAICMHMHISIHTHTDAHPLVHAHTHTYSYTHAHTHNMHTKHPYTHNTHTHDAHTHTPTHTDTHDAHTIVRNGRGCNIILSTLHTSQWGCYGAHNKCQYTPHTC